MNVSPQTQELARKPLVVQADVVSCAWSPVTASLGQSWAELGRGLPCRARRGAEGPASGSGPLRTPDLPARLAAPLLEATWVERCQAPPPRTHRMAPLSPFSFPLLPAHDDSSPPPPHRSVQTFADKSKQEALKNDLVEALKRKQQC